MKMTTLRIVTSLWVTVTAGLGAALAQTRQIEDIHKLARFAVRPIGEIRAAGLKDAHHIIQDAAVRNLPGYNTNAAPGIQLPGPSTLPETPHYRATQVQRLASDGGTYRAERQIASEALEAAGVSRAALLARLQREDRFTVTYQVLQEAYRNKRGIED